jgi:hypothetical protein
MLRWLLRWLPDRADAFAKWLGEVEAHPKYKGVVDVLRVLKVCRWTIGSLLVISILLWSQNQGRDALLTLIAPQKSGIDEVARIVLFIGTVGLWALVSWYLPRLRLYFWSQGYEAGNAAELTATVLPRLLGSLCFVVVGAATWRAGVVDSPRAVPLLLFVMAPLFYVGAAYRRLWLLSLEIARASGEPAVRPRLSLAGLFAKAEIGAPQKTDRRAALDKYARGFLLVAAIAGLWLLVLVALTVSPVGFSQLIGSPPAALLAASFWTAFATAVGVLSDRTKLPWALIVVLWALCMSPWTGDHVVEPHAGFAPDRPGVDQAFTGWLNEHRTDSGRPLPVFFAYAEGGGIRAAYWTAAVLGELTDENRAFPDHLFAISGVSGGSWGATVYAGVHAWRKSKGWLGYDKLSNRYGHTVAAVHEVLRHDLLSPVMAGLLIRDPVQWLGPPLVHLPDRGRAFEAGWEDAWRRALGNDALAGSFFDLTRTGPHLFLTATWAEHGGPIVLSDLTFPSGTTRDFFATFGRDMKASTAAHLSSRFPLFNPPASIEQGVSMHLVDGGYYENSGAETLMQVIDVAVSAAVKAKRAIRPVVIALHNEVEPFQKDPHAYTWATEISAPLGAVVNAANRYTRRAEAVLGQWRLSGGTEVEVLRFDLRPTRKAVPLGWSLSEAAMKEMDDQIVHDNKDERCNVKALLDATAPPCPATKAVRLESARAEP